MEIEKGLMELVEGGVVDSVDCGSYDITIQKAKRLEGLGLKAVAGKLLEELTRKNRLAKISVLKLVKITEEQINEFLKRKVEEYDRKNLQSQPLASEVPYSSYTLQPYAAMIHLLPLLSPPWLLSSRQDNIIGKPSHKVIITKCTIHANSSEEGTIGKFVWTETPLEEYPGIPPEFVLKKIEQYKPSFDSLAIAEVNSVKDPLLLGRINGSSDRYFLAQWGKDVKLDDII